MIDEDKLASLLEEGVIDEVLGTLQSGKEASLYVVRRGTEIAAAKVYKERDRRTFKNNAVYAEGRKVRSSRDERALARGSRHGKATQESAWKAAESETLSALHGAGVRVPRPITFHDGVVIMELVVDSRGEPAPRLIDVRPTADQARAWHGILVEEIVKILLAGWVHGDLSPYNVLISARGPVIIDFPQAVSAAHNGQARTFVERDVRNVTDFLAGFDPSLARLRNSGGDIWRRYHQGDLAPDSTGESKEGQIPPRGPEGKAPVEDAPAEFEDELARQIAAAKAMPHTAPRPRQRRAPAPRPPVEKRARHQTPGKPRNAPRRPAAPRPATPRSAAPRPAAPRPATPRPAAPRPTASPTKPGERRVWGFLADRYDLGDSPDRRS
jgi:RIO kinase 1